MLQRFLVISGLMLVASSARAELKISDINATYQGSDFLRTALDYQPYDNIRFRFRVEGVQVDPQGYVNLRVVTAVSDAGGKVLLTETASPPLPWVGATAKQPISVVLFAWADLSGKFEPGEYRVTVTVNDRLASKKVAFERQIKISPTRFSISEPSLHERPAEHASYPNWLREAPVIGQPLYFSAYVQNIDNSEKKSNVLVNYAVVDADGKELPGLHGDQIIQVIQGNLYSGTEVIYITWPNGVPASGAYSIRLKATDRIANKTASLDVPLHVRAR